MRSGRGWRRRVLGVSLALVLGGCGLLGGADAEEVRAGAVYDAVIRWYVDPPADGVSPRPVFIEPRGEGAVIDLEVQTELISSAGDVADIRFIDERGEALVEENGRLVARDGGLFLRLGPVVEDHDEILLEIDRHIADEEFESLRFLMVERRDVWSVEGEPEVVPID